MKCQYFNAQAYVDPLSKIKLPKDKLYKTYSNNDDKPKFVTDITSKVYKDQQMPNGYTFTIYGPSYWKHSTIQSHKTKLTCGNLAIGTINGPEVIEIENTVDMSLVPLSHKTNGAYLVMPTVTPNVTVNFKARSKKHINVTMIGMKSKTVTANNSRYLFVIEPDLDGDKVKQQLGKLSNGSLISHAKKALTQKTKQNKSKEDKSIDNDVEQALRDMDDDN